MPAAVFVLLLVLWPVCTAARQRTRLYSCQANMVRYGRAFVMYAQDYDGTLPPWYVGVPYREGRLRITTWDLLLRAYLRDDLAGRCPSDTAPAVLRLGCGHTIWRSYAVARNVIWNPGERDNPRDGEFPMRLVNVPRPGETLLLAEKDQGPEVNGEPYPKTSCPAATWGSGSAFENWQQVAWDRHGGGMNVLFVDGHVKPLHGLNQGAFRYPPAPSDKRFRWPRLPGYVYKDGAGAIFGRNANGNQFWEDCPIPGEAPFSKSCQ